MTASVLKLVGTAPDSREVLTMVAIEWHGIGKQVFTKVVGSGSSLLDVALAFDTRLMTWSTSSRVKEERSHCGGKAEGVRISCRSRHAAGGSTSRCCIELGCWTAVVVGVHLVFEKVQEPVHKSIKFNSVLFILCQITTNVISWHLSNTVQFKPIRV